MPVEGSQRLGPGRHADAGPELLGLDDGPLGQLRARDPRREPQVVLDPGGGARLAAGGHGVDHDGVEPLGGAVDGGGQTARPGTDDEEVADRSRRRGLPETDHGGELGVARVAQHLLPAPDDDRCLLR